MVVMKYFLAFLMCSNLQALTWLDEYRSVQAYQKNDYQQAGVFFQKVLSQSPNDLKNLVNMGNILYKQDKFLEASNYFEQALTYEKMLDDQKKAILFNLGSSYAQQEKWQKALDAYEKLIKIDHDNLRAIKNIEIIKKLLEQEEEKKQEEKKEKEEQQQKKESDQQDQESKEQEPKDQGNQENSEPKEEDKQENKETNQTDKQKKTKNKGENDQLSKEKFAEKKESNQAQELMQKLDEQENAYLQAIDQNDQRANAHLMKMQMQQLKGQDNESENNW